MRGFEQPYDFPKQHIPDSQKTDEWGATCCDWIISQAQGYRDVAETELEYEILNGNIPDKFYKKILNPYNATNEKYRRFPATMRNYDLIKGIIRRYVGEYIKSPHYFIVGANNPEVVMAKDAEVRKEIQQAVEQAIAVKLQQSYANWINGGNDPQQFDPRTQVDVEAIQDKVQNDFIDGISAQGAELLEVIKDITEDEMFYARAYFDFVAFGEAYTYTDVVGNKLVKRNVSPRDAFPINTDHIFREDDDMFCERRKMTYQQICDEFNDYLTDKQRDFLDTYYAKQSSTVPNDLTFQTYQEYFPDICGKFTKEDRELFKKQPVMRRDVNSDLYDVWHVVWRGEARKAVVSFVNQTGFIDKRIEDDDYQLDPTVGDIGIEYIYEPQVYEAVRIGTRNDAIYPYGARAIAYNRGGKLPYNGINELLPGFGKFSIVDILTPFQVFYNIVAYHREMVLAKNKVNVLMMAKSLLGTNREEAIYKILADGVFIYDDTTDQGSLRAQQVRMLQSSIGDYLTQLSNLLAEIRQAANDQVDMTPQRYGEIGNSAGKSTTEMAVAYGSMGSVIISFMLDQLRERDYNRDLDYSKFAWIDGLDTSYRDADGNLKYVSLDIKKHVYADYCIKCKVSARETEKLQQLQQYAFSAAQNGDNLMAIAAIEGDNIGAIKKLIEKYQAMKDQHENDLQQMQQQTEQMKEEFELQKIQAKGEEDRKTAELEGQINMQIEQLRANANMVSYNPDTSDAQKQDSIDAVNNAKLQIDQSKVVQDRKKTILDAFNKERDRQVKLKDMETKLAIAKQNKNRYDSASKATKSSSSK